ncbi:MAG TPA: DUF1272 domain-containing protein [Candidatus Dormibacteraeota bacterium]|nr:DUF1272 domain-containing protein [Candidatus Dormibacteraeota bacterium]
MAGLEMRTTCERCGRALAAAGTAFICSYECTFCEGCTAALEGLCPNCGGELVRRPRRFRALDPEPDPAA